ncbi:rhodanese-like domain-containing protein [bacterium]|nr:rhodanese-like domain-containing protein [bacterium]
MIKRISIQSAIVLFGSLITGLAFNSFNPGGIALLAVGHSTSAAASGNTPTSDEILSKPGRTLSLAETHVLFENKAAVFIDARPPSFYQAEHIQNAISVYYKTAGLNPALDRLKKTDPYVVYCKGPNCNQAQLLAETMHKAGFTKIFLFPGGMQEWRLVQYPMDRTP